MIGMRVGDEDVRDGERRVFAELCFCGARALRRRARVDREDAVASRDEVHLGEVEAVGRIDPRRGGLEAGRAAHAAGLPKLEPRCARERDVRRDASADHDEIAVELQAALGHDLAHPLPIALEACQLLTAVQLHPVLLEHTLEEASDLRAERTLAVLGHELGVDQAADAPPQDLFVVDREGHRSHASCTT